MDDADAGYSSPQNTIMDSILESDEKLHIKLSRCICKKCDCKQCRHDHDQPPPYDVKGVQHGQPPLPQSSRLISSSGKCVPRSQGHERTERTRSHPRCCLVYGAVTADFVSIVRGTMQTPSHASSEICSSHWGAWVENNQLEWVSRRSL